MVIINIYFEMHENLNLPWINSTEVPEYYSRYLDIGFANKYQLIYQYNPLYKVSIWTDHMSFSPFAKVDIIVDGEHVETVGYQHLQNFLMGCMFCFIFGFIIEWLNHKRYNMQAKKIYNGHNPLVVRKAL